MNMDWFSFVAGAVATLVMLFSIVICLEVSDWFNRRRVESEPSETAAPYVELIDIRDLEGSESRGT